MHNFLNSERKGVCVKLLAKKILRVKTVSVSDLNSDMSDDLVCVIYEEI